MSAFPNRVTLRLGLRPRLLCNIRVRELLSSLLGLKLCLSGRRDPRMDNLALHFAADTGEDWVSGAGGAASRGEYDFCSRDGALALKAKIEAYWRERGQHVMIALQNVGFHPAIRAARFDVRSDMVNGMPRTTGARKSAPVAEEVFVEDFDLDSEDLAFE